MRTTPFRANDAVAIAVEAHLRSLESEECGRLEVQHEYDGVVVRFGGLRVHGETYDIALVRMAGALLNDDRVGRAFLSRIRGVRDLLSN